MATSNFPNPSDREQQNSNAGNNGGQQQGGDFNNPQQGDSWNNYQTKELSGGGEAESAEEAAKVFEDEGDRA